MTDFSPTDEPRDLIIETIDQLDDILKEARETNKPLEIDPYRSRLFELFARAEAAGVIDEEREPNLTSDGICRAIAGRWGLGENTRQAVMGQEKLSGSDLSRMRMLWSLMRLWMEWTYAWDRWDDFH